MLAGAPYTLLCLRASPQSHELGVGTEYIVERPTVPGMEDVTGSALPLSQARGSALASATTV